MRVLIIGQGGREHALAWRLTKSESVSRVFVAPGNAGTATDATNVAIPEEDTAELVRFARREKIDLLVIGPEAPLVAGLADDLRKAELTVFGPSAAASKLEGSKVFCKRILRAAGAPTAKFQVFDQMEVAEEYLATHLEPCVVKVDGLAAGKGVFVCDGPNAAFNAAKSILIDQSFGKAGELILIEERLVGSEVSVFAITDGKSIVILDACHDYKRAQDGDCGPNTGGMGSICPTPRVTPELLAQIERDILIPVIHEMNLQKCPFQGVLFAGLMLTQAGPQVLEFNVRFGDPETQALMMRFTGDLGKLLHAAATGRLSGVKTQWDPRTAVCVVAASGGYPGSFKKGYPIRGLDDASTLPNVKVFHAGTKTDDDRVVTNGGRVLGVTALGESAELARQSAYDGMSKLKFTNMHYRKDIADIS